MSVRPGRTLARWTLGLFALLGVLAGLGLAAWHIRSPATVIAAQLEAAPPWLALWRALLFTLLIGGWPRWVEWLSVRYRWSAAHRDRVAAQRWRVAVWLLVIELLVVQGVLGRFVQQVVGL